MHTIQRISHAMVSWALVLMASSCFFELGPCLTTALVHGVDSSQQVSTEMYANALAAGFTKAIIRGYTESCREGGSVDLNFVPNYNNSRTAGYTDIDTYWFPCTGSGNPCKSFASQIAEIGQTFVANSMKIGTIWIDLEQSGCGGWNYGASGNLDEARQIIAAARASGYNFGIYSSPGEWSDLFGSAGVVLATDFPLWFALWDNDDSSLNLTQPFGGWTTAVGKQYSDKSTFGPFDLDIFAH